MRIRGFSVVGVLGLWIGVTVMAAGDPPGYRPIPPLKKPYLEGLAKISAAQKTVLEQYVSGVEKQRIALLQGFLAKSVAWGETLPVEGNPGKRYLVTEESPKDPSAVILFSFAAKTEQGYNLQTKGVQLTITQFPVTPAWAGILLIHELSHLEAAVRGEGGGMETAEGVKAWLLDEQRAYEVELAAANVLSGGRVGLTLKKAAEALKPKDSADLHSKMSQITEDEEAHLLGLLSKAVGAGPPAGKVERQLRRGFFYASLGIAFYPDAARRMEWMRVLHKDIKIPKIRKALNKTGK